MAYNLLLQGLKAMSAIGVPLYITETGVADERNVLREEMMTTYFAQACALGNQMCYFKQ